METPIHYSDLSEFLTKHNAKNETALGLTSTHTRIPGQDKSAKIFGGSFVIPAEELETFHALYYTDIFVKHKSEYLTEKQLTDGTGPILLDFDFRYNYDVDTRQHTKEHITDILTGLYLEKLKDFFTFTEQEFQIYVLEKPDVIRLQDKDLTKDGIHIIIGVQMDHIMQQMLREKVLKEIEEIWDLPLINKYDSVLDEGISKGTTNWQMFGSKKPGNIAYELTGLYNVSMDERDSEFRFEEVRIDEIDMSAEFSKMSAQYNQHPRFEMNPKLVKEYESRTDLKKSKLKKTVSKTKITLLCEEDDTNIELKDIINATILDKAINNIFKTLSTDLSSEEYKLKEVHEYTQILPEIYYEAGSHEKNRLVAFALKNTDNRLFLSWIKLRSKASDFEYSSIEECYDKWTKYFNKTNESSGLTYKSIIFWAKQDANEEYLKIKNKSIDYYIDQTIFEPTEWDFAMILFNMFKDKYICTSITNKTWYVFNNHCWEEDKGNRLRYAISRELYNIYRDKRDLCGIEAAKFETGDPRRDAFSKKVEKLSAIIPKFKTSSDKNNIYREAHEIFYDKAFVEKMDSNKYLMSFSNGVIDFKNKVFRDGLPQDYITKSTRINYIDYSTVNGNCEIVQSILAFMEQLFPDKNLNRYMWDHLASVLIGENMNQTFNIYVGSGSNGKSILMDLMAQTLGQYKGTVPITLVTDKRNSIGGTSSEVIQLKGIRYAVMQEPSKNATINEGVMKELTGGDPIQARGLYKESETFIPQFSLAVCTNSLFDITSNDDGTWRRIRICNFMSKFVDEITEDYFEEGTKQFLKDKTLKEKLPMWAPVFASMLVKRAFENQGKVEDCDVVMSASNKYRNNQDYIAAFVNDKIEKEVGKRVKQAEISEEFKAWYIVKMGGRTVPKAQELYDYMDKKFGATKGKCWQNVKIIYSSDATEDDVQLLTDKLLTKVEQNMDSSLLS
jgi:P4 family phage/plasmid primase-like protien